MANRLATVLAECRTQAAAVKHINDPAITKISDGSAAGAVPSEVTLNDPHSPYGSVMLTILGNATGRATRPRSGDA